MLIKSQKLLYNFWVVVKYRCGSFVHRTLKSLSQEWSDEMSWFFSSWYKSRKAESFIMIRLALAKNGWGPIDQEILKSGVSHKWFDELRRLTERFLHVNRDARMFSLTFKFCGIPAVVHSQSFYREKIPLGKSDPKISFFFFILKSFVIDFCWKCTLIKTNVVQSLTLLIVIWWDSQQGSEFPRLNSLS